MTTKHGEGGGGIEQKAKRTHGQLCGDCNGGECIRGLNGNGKYNKKQN